MKLSVMLRTAVVIVALCAVVWTGGYATEAPADKAPEVTFQHQPGKLVISIGGSPFAHYVYEDSTISRPYFAHIKTASGIQVTRNHPPVDGVDPVDHATIHPGMFLGFGDISGHDYWRLKARVKLEKFVEEPRSGVGKGTFAVRNAYLAKDGRGRVCTEICRYTILVRPAGYLLILDSTFSSDSADLVFGEQDEMGLGVRVNTKISVRHGNGHITNAEGLRDEPQVRTAESDWCDYSGIVDNHRIGVTLMPNPGNLRRCWYHARNSGFMGANFFGRDGGTNPFAVKKGEKFRFGYGVLIYPVPASEEVDLNVAYQDYLRQIQTGKNRP